MFACSPGRSMKLRKRHRVVFLLRKAGQNCVYSDVPSPTSGVTVTHWKYVMGSYTLPVEERRSLFRMLRECCFGFTNVPNNI